MFFPKLVATHVILRFRIEDDLPFCIIVFTIASKKMARRVDTAVIIWGSRRAEYATPVA